MDDMTASTSLTSTDRYLIAEARRIGPPLRASNSASSRLQGWLLQELADLAERLGAAPTPAPDAPLLTSLDSDDWNGHECSGACAESGG